MDEEPTLAPVVEFLPNLSIVPIYRPPLAIRLKLRNEKPGFPGAGMTQHPDATTV